jgi:hypothetical protein
MIQGFKRLKLRDILKYMFIVTGNNKVATRVTGFSFSPALYPLFIIFTLVCILFFHMAWLLQDIFYKTSGGTFSMIHTLQEYGNKHSPYNKIHFTSTLTPYEANM